MSYRKITVLTVGLLLLVIGGGQAADTTATLLMEQAQRAMYYAADGAQAQVSIVLLSKSGRIDERKFWLVRRDIEDLGDQRYFICHTAPDSLARLAYLIHKKRKGEDNRWQYIPATGRVLRIPSADRRSPFAATDFTYEDISGRLPILDDHQLVGPDSTLRRRVTKVKSTPRDSTTADYAYRISWIDNETKLIVKEEYFAADTTLVRLLEAGRIEVIEEIPTVVIWRATDMRTPHWTSLSILEVTYQTKLTPQDFNQDLLKDPPPEFTK